MQRAIEELHNLIGNRAGSHMDDIVAHGRKDIGLASELRITIGDIARDHITQFGILIAIEAPGITCGDGRAELLDIAEGPPYLMPLVTLF